MTRRNRPMFTYPIRRTTLCVVFGFLSGCGSGPAEAPAATSIDRETFIATYVDLRAAAVRAGDKTVTAVQRAAILQQHGVTEDDLLAFATANGEKVAYMRGVWDEVEHRLDALHLADGGT